MTGDRQAGATLLGYVDRLSVAPGQDISLMTSTTVDHQVELVRLIHGALDPRGPGPRDEVVHRFGTHAASLRPWPSGSCLSVPAHPALDVEQFTVCAWICPTLQPDGRSRAIVARGDARAGRGWMLGLDGDGALGFWSGPAQRPQISTGRAVPAHQWTLVVAAVDGRSVTLLQVPEAEWPVGSWRASTQGSVVDPIAGAGLPLMIAAEPGTSAVGRCSHFTGRIDRPRILTGAMVPPNTDPATWDAPVLASWHPLGPGDDPVPSPGTVRDTGPHGLHAEVINNPTRGVPGANWSGREIDFRLSPDEYGAIHFHDDDLDDARWPAAITFRIPDQMPSGVYAFRIRAGSEQADVGFAIRPPRGSTTAPMAVLLPTFTYLAYANSHGGLESDSGRRGHHTPTPAHRWAAENKVCSLYDRHRDGSGCYYASPLRPLTTITPQYSGPFGLWNLSADLCLIAWLEHQELAYDVITDHDLHEQGASLLAGYRTVLTGSHPEYYSAAMLDAQHDYLAGGGAACLPRGQRVLLGDRGAPGPARSDRDPPWPHRNTWLGGTGRRDAPEHHRGTGRALAAPGPRTAAARRCRLHLAGRTRHRPAVPPGARRAGGSPRGLRHHRCARPDRRRRAGESRGGRNGDRPLGP